MGDIQTPVWGTDSWNNIRMGNTDSKVNRKWYRGGC